MQNGSEISHADFPVSTFAPSATFAALAQGDQLEVQQPIGTPVESFTVPPTGVVATSGSATGSGVAPAGWQAVLLTPGNCNDGNDGAAIPVGGDFSFSAPRAPIAGDSYSLYTYSGKGDVVKYATRLAGESPCLSVKSHLRPPYPGSPSPAQPYSIRVSGLRAAVASDLRTTLTRGGSNILDQTVAIGGGSYTNPMSVRPQPGDTVSVYRPAAAPSPELTFTIPQISALYDVSSNLVALDAPAGSSASAWLTSSFLMQANVRNVYRPASGRTLFDFSKPQGSAPAMAVVDGDNRWVEWGSADGRHEVTVDVVPGDLTAPVITFKLKKKLALGKLRSKFKLKVTSNEAATIAWKLEFRSRKKGGKPVRIASSSSPVTGSGTLSAKLTSVGRKALSKLRKKGRKFKGQKATVTLVATDPAGNATTLVKSFRVVRK